jgi:hypothetical protein
MEAFGHARGMMYDSPLDPPNIMNVHYADLTETNQSIY